MYGKFDPCRFCRYKIKHSLNNYKVHAWIIPTCAFFVVLKEVVRMETEWNWKIKGLKIIKERRIKNEIWRIWWSICISRTKRKIK